MNSIVDNPVYGDELQFIQLRQKGQSKTAYRTTAQAQIGQTYEIVIYYENSAAPNKEAARDVRVGVSYPEVVNGAAAVQAMITSTNTTPKAVWSFVGIDVGSGTFASLAPVDGSAVLHTNGEMEGRKLKVKDLVSRQGALVGCDQLNGIISGESRCSGYITFDVRVDEIPRPNFTVTALGNPGSSSSDLTKTPAIKVGNEIRFRVEYKNVGNIQQDNVTVSASGLDSDFSAVPSSMGIRNSKTVAEHPNEKYVPLSRNPAIERVNIGSYAPGGNCFITFTMKTSDSGKFSYDKGERFAWIKFKVETEAGWKEDTVTVVIFGPQQKVITPGP
ncbi:hypothetical protein BIU82_13935 [Arthrobacter sp. SW1]|uniref:hypothetical protein n=1 Tax=Arthrobacter sp. SW1 TaxID=1920889 RepID=UPI000877C032|nr:hypothetical protein [Arthrobacter sp. SW1]OFI39427.1 hypothetical protein BIU82_13935 [Arthrobacter sp. SW1]